MAASNAADAPEAAAWANMPSLDEFVNVLQAAQSPPVPQPPPPPNPPVTDGEKELQSNEPTAQTEKPDLSSEDDEAGDDSKKVKKPAQPAASPVPLALVPQAAGPAPAVKAVTADPGKTPARAGPSVTPVSAKGAATPQPEKVSLSELPTDPVAKISSATAAVEPAVAKVPVADDKVSVAPVLDVSDVAAQAPTSAKSDVSDGSALSDLSDKSGAPDVSGGTAQAAATTALDATALATTDLATATAPPSIAPVTDPTIGAPPLVTSTAQSAQTTQSVQASQSVQSLGTVQTTASNNTFSSSHGGPGGKTDADSAVQAIGQAGPASGQAGGQSAGAQPGQSQNQSQTEDVIREIAQHTEKLALRTASENVTVHLQTDDDTNISMNVKSSRGEVQAQFMTNNEGLRNALHENRTQLAHNLENKGMNLGQVSVGLKNSSSRQDHPAPRQNQGARAAVAAPTQLNETGKATASFTTPADGVDLWI